jgi:AcrR family transcriptional regulator
MYTGIMHETKRRILGAARAILIAEGSGAFSMRKVATTAGLSLSNVQYYFKSRAELLDGILEGFIEGYRAYLSGLGGLRGQGPDALRGFVREILREESDNEEIRFFRSLFSFTESEVLSERLDAFYREVEQILRTGLAGLAGRGAEDPAVGSAAAILLPYLNGYGMVSGVLATDPDESARLVAEWVWDIVNSGL